MNVGFKVESLMACESNAFCNYTRFDVWEEVGIKGLVSVVEVYYLTFPPRWNKLFNYSQAGQGVNDFLV